MHRSIRFLFLLILSAAFLSAEGQILPAKVYHKQLQTRGEIYFAFAFKNHTQLQQLGHFLSVDRVKGDTAFVYADRTGFYRFLSARIPFHVLTPPSERLSAKQLSPSKLKSTEEWDSYPSYYEYVALMQNFEKQYPDLCKIVSIGKSVNGRDLLFAHIRPPGVTADTLPQFMYTSTMHGDETTGYILMLHLIDYLLKNYGKDTYVTHLVDSLDIWINPLANPDGTYAGGNSSVYGATRFNANHVDLNRNYPDPRVGIHPDGKAWQPETQAFLHFAQTRHFVLSCNLHTGSEVANYPWDTWKARTADDAWWQNVCRQYADTVHAHAPDDYFTDLNDGITDGYDWYSISGGRQDYMNYFRHDREFTLELSSVKMPDPARLPDYWEYNYRSLLNYMHQTLTGLRGKVKDSLNGRPLKAEVFLLDHDTLQSQVYSDSVSGNYFRPVYPGTYNIRFSAQGYHPKIVSGVRISGNRPIVLNVALVPDSTTGTEPVPALSIKVFPNPASTHLNIPSTLLPADIRIISLSGKIIFERKNSTRTSQDISHLPKGFYLLKIVSGRTVRIGKFEKR
jgi:murein tripeptide amidase MpaA